MWRLYQREVEAQQEALNKTRKLQVGTGMRSDRIRTYNFTQDRITDHRIGMNMHQLDDFLTGGEELDEMISSLADASKKERIQQIVMEILDNPEHFCKKFGQYTWSWNENIRFTWFEFMIVKMKGKSKKWNKSLFGIWFI